LIIEAAQKAHEILVNVVPMTLAQFVHLADQVIVVLISEGRHKAIGIAMSIAPMAGRALLSKNAATQRHARTIAGLRRNARGYSVQIGCHVDPGLRSAQLLLRDNSMHRVAVALSTGKIGKLSDEVSEALACERWN
jgi:hypothetical protein